MYVYTLPRLHHNPNPNPDPNPTEGAELLVGRLIPVSCSFIRCYCFSSCQPVNRVMNSPYFMARWPLMVVRKLSPISYLPSIQQSRTLHKKSHKGGRRDRGGVSDSDDKRPDEIGGSEITLIDDAASLDETKERMQRVVDGINKELSQMRSGKADAGMFDHIRVQAYGKPSSLSSIAQASLKGPQQLVYTPFDSSLAKAIDYALRQSGMSLNPQIEDGVVKVHVPKLTQEAREAMAKIANKQTEKARLHLRGIRHSVMDNIKKHASKFSKDDVFKRGKEIDAITHSMEEKCVKAVVAKKADIMSV